MTKAKNNRSHRRQIPQEPKQKAPASERRELRREEYNRHIDLFKFYCDIALKANLYFYLITGGITSFYFSTLSRSDNSSVGARPGPLKFIEFTFLLPIFMSGVLGGIFIYGRHLWSEIVDTVEDIREELGEQGLPIKKTPEVGLLASLLLIFGVLFFLVGGALTVFMAVQIENSSTPNYHFILLLPIAILIAGIFLPYLAPRINWTIKRLRKRNRRKLIKKWYANLRKPKLAMPHSRFKDSFLYFKLRPHLSEETIKMIRTGIFDRSLIRKDLKKLKLK